MSHSHSYHGLNLGPQVRQAIEAVDQAREIADNMGDKRWSAFAAQ